MYGIESINISAVLFIAIMEIFKNERKEKEYKKLSYSIDGQKHIYHKWVLFQDRFATK